MSKRIIALFSLVLLAFLYSCDRDTPMQEPKYASAYVDSTMHVHWGRGFYKLRVFYSFEIDGQQISGVDDFGKERSYTASIAFGDSVQVVYDKSDLNNNKIVKLIYKKRKLKL